MKRRYAACILLFGGACLLLKGGWNLATYAAFQSHPEWFHHADIPVTDQAKEPRLPLAFRPVSGLREVADLHVLGRLEVARLRMSVLIVEGDDQKNLGLAAGHLSDTAKLGAKGNAVIAGHRDSSFWPLRKIKPGDRIRVRAGKNYDYVVRNVRIVNPDDVSVLNSEDDEKVLTLVTCYPFRYFGSAPKRFIVQAVIPTS